MTDSNGEQQCVESAGRSAKVVRVEEEGEEGRQVRRG